MGKISTEFPHRLPRRWTKAEFQVVRRHYRKQGAKPIAKLLGRTIKAIQKCALRLEVVGPKGDRWSEGEMRYLRKSYGRRTALQIARSLGRTEQSVRGKIHLMHLGTAVFQEWTAREIDFLREQYHTMTHGMIALRLRRTVASIEMKGRRLGLGEPVVRLSEAKLEKIRSLIGTIAYTEIGRKFGVPATRIRSIAASMGYRARPTSRRWLEAEDKFLVANWKRFGAAGMALALGRTELAVGLRAYENGIAPAPSGRPSTGRSRRRG
jgi:hypothetical protein